MMSYNEAYGIPPVKLIDARERQLPPLRRQRVNLRHTMEKMLGSDVLYPVVALVIALCIVIMLFSINSKLNKILRA